MRDDDRIIELLTEQLEEVKQIRKELPEVIREATRKWLPIILMSLTLIVALVQPGTITGIETIIKLLQQQDRENGPVSPPQPPIEDLTFPDLMEKMKKEQMTDKRFALLETNLDSIPSDLSLSKLNEIIELFQPHGYRVEIVRLLYSRLETNYSAEEYETFKNLFNPYRLYELKKMGLQPEEPK